MQRHVVLQQAVKLIAMRRSEEEVDSHLEGSEGLLCLRKKQTGYAPWTVLSIGSLITSVRPKKRKLLCQQHT